MSRLTSRGGKARITCATRRKKRLRTNGEDADREQIHQHMVGPVYSLTTGENEIGALSDLGGRRCGQRGEKGPGL